MSQIVFRYGFAFLILIIVGCSNDSGSDSGGDSKLAENERVACSLDDVSDGVTCDKQYHMLSFNPEAASFGFYDVGLAQDSMTILPDARSVEGDDAPSSQILAWPDETDIPGVVSIGESSWGMQSVDGSVIVAPLNMPVSEQSGMSVLYQKSLSADSSLLDGQQFSCSGIKTRKFLPNLPVRVRLQFKILADGQDQLRWDMRFLHSVFIEENKELIESLTNFSELNPIEITVEKQESEQDDGFQTYVNESVFNVSEDGRVDIASDSGLKLTGFMDQSGQLLSLVETNSTGFFEMVLNCVKESTDSTPEFNGQYLRSHVAVDPFAAADHTSIAQANVLSVEAVDETELILDDDGDGDSEANQSSWVYEIKPNGEFLIDQIFADAMLSPDGQFMISTALDFTSEQFSYDLGFAIQN